MNRFQAAILGLASVAAGIALLLVLESRSKEAALSTRAEKLEERLAAIDSELHAARQEIEALKRLQGDSSRGQSDATSTDSPSQPTGDSILGEILQRLATVEQTLEVALASDSGGESDVGMAERERTRAVLSEVRNEELRTQLEHWAAREEKKTRERMEKLPDRLQLSAAQTADLARVFSEEEQAHGDLMAELWEAKPGEGSNTEMRTAEENWKTAVERMKLIRKERDEKLARILTPTQLAEFEAYIKEDQRSAKDRPSPRAGTSPSGDGR